MEPADVRATTRHDTNTTTIITTEGTRRVSTVRYSAVAVLCAVYNLKISNVRMSRMCDSGRAPCATATRHEPELRRKPSRAAPNRPERCRRSPPRAARSHWSNVSPTRDCLFGRSAPALVATSIVVIPTNNTDVIV